MLVFWQQDIMWSMLMQQRTLGIPVTNIPTYGTSSVAQMAVSHILSFAQRVKEHAGAVADGRWTTHTDFCFWDYPLIELEGKTVGVVGFGRIGQRFADMIAGFGCRVLAYDTYKSDQSARQNFSWTDLDTLFRESDFISLHCPLFPETEGIVNAGNLKKMKKTALLVNTSRGTADCRERPCGCPEQRNYCRCQS